MPAGQPTKLTYKMKGQIKLLALKGFTDVEMAGAVGVTERTINNWKKQQPKFFQSLKDWKAEADLKVEKSLYERAMGYEHPEDKIFNDGGEPLIVPTTKHYPPDTTAIIYWLKNRKKADWKDKTEQDVNIKDARIKVDYNEAIQD